MGIEVVLYSITFKNLDSNCVNSQRYMKTINELIRSATEWDESMYIYPYISIAKVLIIIV